MCDILVIKANFPIKPKYLENIRKDILKQKEQRVVVIPFGFDTIMVPEDITVKFENYVEGEWVWNLL